MQLHYCTVWRNDDYQVLEYDGDYNVVAMAKMASWKIAEVSYSRNAWEKLRNGSKTLNFWLKQNRTVYLLLPQKEHNEWRQQQNENDEWKVEINAVE